MRTTFLVNRLTFCIAAFLGPILLGTEASAGGLFWPHNGYSQTTRIRGQYPATATTIVPATSGVVQPGSLLPPLQMVQFAPGQTAQSLAQPGQLLQYTGTQPNLSAGSSGTVLMLQTGQTLNTAPQGNGIISLSTSPTDPVGPNDSVFLAAISQNNGFFQNIEKFVQGQLQDLLNGRGQGLSNTELEAILLGLVKAALPPQFSAFAPEITKAAELIIQRIIHRIVSNNRPAQNPAPNQNTNPPGSQNGLPFPSPNNGGGNGGAFTFEVSGRIVLTPVSGNTPAVTPPPKADATPNPNTNPNTNPANTTPSNPASILNNPKNEAQPAPHPTR